MRGNSINKPSLTIRLLHYMIQWQTFVRSVTNACSIQRGKILNWVRDFDSFQKDTALCSLLEEHLLQFSVRVNFISHLTLISNKSQWERTRNFTMCHKCKDKFLVNKTNRCTDFQFHWYYDSTCFGQSFCPSLGVLSRSKTLVQFMQFGDRALPGAG